MSTTASNNFAPLPPGAGYPYSPTAPTSGANQKRQSSGSIGRADMTSTRSSSPSNGQSQGNTRHSSSFESPMIQSMSGLTISPNPRQNIPQLNMSPPQSAMESPSLVFPLPSVFDLKDVEPHLSELSIDAQVTWIRDVLSLVTRVTSPSPASSGTDLQTGPVHIEDTELQQLADSAITHLLNIVPTAPSAGTKMPKANAEALYIRATLTASGAFPSQIPQNSRVAFRTFEAAARAGHYTAWFRLGRDYEAFGDSSHARDCFERGARSDDVSCLYRLGVYLLFL